MSRAKDLRNATLETQIYAHCLPTLLSSAWHERETKRDSGRGCEDIKESLGRSRVS